VLVARLIELVSGAVACLITPVMAGVALYWGAALWLLALLVLSAVGIGIGAYQHSVRGGKWWLRLLSLSSLLLAVLAVPTIPGLGFYLPIAALLAVAASMAGSRRRQEDGTAAG
jgi:peptidoglycan/LPS O-acetylase OafA/YrhL